ncbi:MAG: NADPH-dependent reductase, partial [Massilia sp.]|nr:NADPH-dependent reductase [Massilia sp.]
DWLVSFEPFTGKPVAVLNASARAHHADDALRETLQTMGAIIVEPASVTIPILVAKRDHAAMVSDPDIAAAIRAALAALSDAIKPYHGEVDDSR